MTKDQGPSIDPALRSGLTQSRFSRRQMLRYAGVGAGTLGLAAFLAACGTKGVPARRPAAARLPNAGIGTNAWWDKQKLNQSSSSPTGPTTSTSQHGKHPSIEEFTKKTGIRSTTARSSRTTTQFFAKISPSLQGGQPTGYDLIVMTNNSPPLA